MIYSSRIPLLIPFLGFKSQKYWGIAKLVPFELDFFSGFIYYEIQISGKMANSVYNDHDISVFTEEAKTESVCLSLIFSEDLEIVVSFRMRSAFAEIFKWKCMQSL